MNPEKKLNNRQNITSSSELEPKGGFKHFLGGGRGWSSTEISIFILSSMEKSVLTFTQIIYLYWREKNLLMQTSGFLIESRDTTARSKPQLY